MKRAVARPAMRNGWKGDRHGVHLESGPGEPVESPKITSKHQRNLLDGSSSCRCSTTSHGDLRTTRKNANQMLNSSLSMQRDSEQGNGHSSDLDRRKSGTLFVKTVHKENGTKLLS